MIGAGDDDFSVSVGRILAGAKERARIAFVATAFEGLSRVKELTPVRTGNLRANWQIQRDSEALPAVRQALPADATSASEMLRQMQQQAEQDGTPDTVQLAKEAAGAQLGEKLRIVNPVVYARAIEYGREIEKKDGTTVSLKGHGMVAQTIAEIPEIAKAQVKAMNQRDGR